MWSRSFLKDEHLQEFSQRQCKLVQEGSWWCRFTDGVVTPEVPLSATVWAGSCSELIQYLLPDHGRACVRERARITLQFRQSSREELYDKQPVCVNVHVSRMRRAPVAPPGFSFRPADEMQTCMFLQRSVTALTERRWQAASGLPVDGSLMLGCDTHTHLHLHVCSEVPSLASAGVSMTDSKHIRLTFGRRKGTQSCPSNKSEESLIKTGKWKSLQQRLILTDTGTGNKRGITETL